MNESIKPAYFINSGPEIFKHIPGYNGYIISNYGTMISFKHYKKYPNGYLLRPDKHGKYEISNTRHDRIKESVEYFIDLAFTNQQNTALPPPNSYYCGYNKLKDIPHTKEERAAKGYSIYDNIHDALEGKKDSTVQNPVDESVNISFDFFKY